MPRYEDYSEAEQANVRHFTHEIFTQWNKTPTDAIPEEMHPHWDPCDWGLPLLRALAHLAHITKGNYQKALEPLNISALLRFHMEGGVVGSDRLRVEDVHFAIENLGGELEEEGTDDEAAKNLAKSLRKTQKRIDTQPRIMSLPSRGRSTETTSGDYEQQKVLPIETSRKQKRPGKGSKVSKRKPKSTPAENSAVTSTAVSVLPSASKKRSAPDDSEPAIGWPAHKRPRFEGNVQRSATPQPQTPSPRRIGSHPSITTVTQPPSNSSGHPESRHSDSSGTIIDDGSDAERSYNDYNDIDYLFEDRRDSALNAAFIVANSQTKVTLDDGEAFERASRPEVSTTMASQWDTVARDDRQDADRSSNARSKMVAGDGLLPRSYREVDQHVRHLDFAEEVVRQRIAEVQHETQTASESAPRIIYAEAVSAERRRLLRTREIRDIKFDIEQAEAMARASAQHGFATEHDWAARMAVLRKTLARLQDEVEDEGA